MAPALGSCNIAVLVSFCFPFFMRSEVMSQCDRFSPEDVSVWKQGAVVTRLRLSSQNEKYRKAMFPAAQQRKWLDKTHLLFMRVTSMLWLGSQKHASCDISSCPEAILRAVEVQQWCHHSEDVISLRLILKLWTFKHFCDILCTTCSWIPGNNWRCLVTLYNQMLTVLCGFSCPPERLSIKLRHVFSRVQVGRDPESRLESKTSVNLMSTSNHTV